MESDFMKKITLMMVVLLLVLYTSNAADYYFNDTSGDHKWSTASNWNPAGLAASDDSVYFDEDYAATGRYCEIVEGDNLTFYRLYMSSTAVAKNTYIKMTGGSILATSGIDLGYFHFYDSTFVAARFEQLGGDIVSNDYWRIGFRTGYSEWLLRGGTVTCNRILFQTNPAQYSRIVIENGFFSVKGNVKAAMEALFGTVILPYNGEGTLMATYNPTARSGVGETVVERIAPKTVTAITASASSEYSASRAPAYVVNGAGLTEMSHTSSNSYTMWQDLNIAEFPKWFKLDLQRTYSAEELKIWNYNWAGYTSRGVRNLDLYVADGTADPGNPVDHPQNWVLSASNITIPEAPGTNAYDTPAIIDIGGEKCRWIALKLNQSWGGGYGGLSEVQVVANSIRQACNPQPANNYDIADINPVLGWLPAAEPVAYHHVYFGTDYAQVTNAANPAVAPGVGSYQSAQYTPPTLEYGRDYYWRVDEQLYNGLVVKGDVWHFATASEVPLPDKSAAISPAQNAFAGIYDNLRWQAVESAQSYEVYFGEDIAAVYNAVNPYVVSTNSTADATLEYGRDYYWRVDVRNQTGLTKGDVWHFTTYAAPASLNEYFTAVEGNDNNPGTMEQPFATLKRARDAVRFAKGINPDRNITVWLGGGKYALNQTLDLTTIDGGSGAYKVVYSSYPGSVATVTSDVYLNDWQQLTVAQQPAGLPTQASGKIWAADIPALAPRFKVMYAGAAEMPRARAAGFVPRVISGDQNSKNRLYCPQGVLSDWQNLSDIELLIRADVPYSMNILPIKSIDMVNRILTTVFSSENYLVRLRPTDEVAPSESAWIENVPQGMTEPGRWFYNSIEGKVYLWPLSESVANGEISVPALCNYIKVSGDEQSNTPVRNIVFNRIKFTRGDRYAIIGNEYSEKVQHGWEFYDSDNAMIKFRWATGCGVKRCEFKNTGGTAIKLDGHARLIEISESNFENIGGTGIFLCGPDNSTQINQYNKIFNNRIKDTGQKFWNGHGILVYQSQSNFIARNLVANTPYTGITITGSRDITTSNDNIVEGNEVYNTCTVLGDGNGIYLRYAGTGNIVRGNYIHHIYASGSHGAVRCDNYQANVTIENNIIYKCAYTGIIIKAYNIVRNNIIVDLYQSGDEGFEWGIAPKGFILLRPDVSCGGAVISNNIFYNSGSPVNFYEDGKNNLSLCAVDNNVYYTLADQAFTDSYLAAMKALGIDAGSVAADPLFTDIDTYKLSPSSPALARGFQNIIFENIGLKPFADLNRDCIVDMSDFSLLAKYWMTDSPSADIAPQAADGSIDAADLIELTINWMN